MFVCLAVFEWIGLNYWLLFGQDFDVKYVGVSGNSVDGLICFVYVVLTCYIVLNLVGACVGFGLIWLGVLLGFIALSVACFVCGGLSY